MTESDKHALLELCVSNQITVIEDGIYNDLYFGVNRPRSLYSYDRTGTVIYCSSFSKSLSRYLRLGWIAPGKYRDRVLHLKVVTSLAS